ncbi:MAG: long-chain fatty acid--CoA ligase [Alphaproteobacteria bacterium]|nr:long-chain fatty acid--CoA ligase [Alphaproteobacteria bacterium]
MLDWLECRPDRVALRWQGTDITYGEMVRRAGRTASALAARGIARGDRVAILAHNCPDYLDLLFACARLGAVLVTLNWRLAPPEWQYILEHSGAKLLAHEGEFSKALDTLNLRLIRTGLDLPSCEGGEVPPVAGKADDPLLLVYTSGTTGRPKGAVHTGATLMANAAAGVEAHAMVPGDRILTFLPMFHVGGLNNQTLPAISVGATVILQPRFAPDTALAAIEGEKPTIILLVPAVMKALVEHPRFALTDLSSLRFAMAGSSVVPVELIRAFHARGLPVGQIYGSTETGPVSIVLKREDAMRKTGACGVPALGCQVRLVDDDGRDVPSGASGEVLIKAPNLMTGYWRDEAATREALADGWYRTGDVGRRDAEGFYWVDERKKDMIISGGENIYPAELEVVLDSCPAIAEGAVIARADPKWGEVPVAVIVRREGASLREEEVRQLFEGRLARFKHPHSVVFVDALPRNVMGKILRYRLREQFGS